MNEIDLLAYADGLLDPDPARKAAIERHLEAHPEDAARVAEWRAQSEALHAAFDSRLAEPVPDRLYAALEDRRRGGWAWLRAAAVVALMAGASASGWMLGRSDQPPQWSAKSFLAEIQLGYGRSGGGAAPAMLVEARGEPLGWLADRISFTLEAPDLSGMGFALVDKRTVQIGGEQVVRLLYEASDGRSFGLFMRPRWQDRSPDLELVEDNGMALAHWLDGPLHSAVASQLPGDETLEIAREVRAVLRDPERTQPPVLSSEPATRRDAGLTAGSLATDGASAPDRTGLPPPPVVPEGVNLSTN